MLKYKVKLDTSSATTQELPLQECYLSQDLSFISGVTDASYHVGTYASLQASNSLVNSDSTLSVSADNVTRQGFIIIKNKVYKVKHGSLYDYSSSLKGDDIKNIDYSYIEIGGRYFYFHDFGDGNSGYTVSDFLSYDSSTTQVSSSVINVIADKNAESITIDTIIWIEDGTVSIDNATYIFDGEESGGILKYTENGEALSFSAITDCEGIEYHPFADASHYYDVTKLVLTKAPMQEEDFISIGYCSYYFYVRYKDNYCPIVKTLTDDGFVFQCRIPSYLVNGDDSDKSMQYSDVIYFDNGDETPFFENDVEPLSMTSENAKIYGITEMDGLTAITCYAKIENEYFQVENDIINANSGSHIMIQLSNSYSTLMENSFVEIALSPLASYNALVRSSESADQGLLEQYIVLDGVKYPILPNIQDKSVIDGVHYDIEYINGKTAGTDCLVDINGEQVPMKIRNTDQGEYSAGQVERYGYINSGNSATTAVYDIKPYSGVMIEGNKYLAYYQNDNGDDAVILSNGTYYFVALGESYTYRFIVTQTRGSSLFVCKPYLNSTDFSQDMISSISESICREVIDNESRISVLISNKIFGTEPINDRTVFQHTDSPVSSDDFYNLFQDLKVFAPQGFINLHLPLYMNVANNIMQEDIVGTSFFDKEKKKAINPIVDMEKDVYVPKVLNGVYAGASTLFSNIEQINFNLHFRTRSLDTWKIYDSANNFGVSGETYDNCLDNWFITDYYPYRQILATSADTLLHTSDLMGLLYFTNSDVFYQREKIAKSFLRLSYYDSPNPQTQSLLATSCIFMDEHKAYKTYIDNSRKNINEYGHVTEPSYLYEADGTKQDVTELSKSNKISVLTEYLGAEKQNKKYSTVQDSRNILIDESKRVSSALIVNNKYETDTSSEGYYLYMFKEYSEKLHPKPIYMKIEFNHAGVGRTIPFIIPMKWEQIGSLNKDAPTRALSLHEDDLQELCKGIPLSHVYAQTYIPLYAVYDFVNQEYCYIFDSRYVSVDENGIANINLFEMKIQDETSSFNNEMTAVINVNDKQFSTQSFNTLMV